MSEILEQVPQFWQGFLSSILAAIVIAIFIGLWRLFSTQARESKLRKHEQLQELRSKMSSPDSVVRVEGYFITLFTLLKYLFVASILWVVAFAMGFVGFLGALVAALLSLFVYYLGLQWLYDTLRPPLTTSQNREGRVLTIHLARYGAGNQYSDVTSVLAGLMSQGGVEVYAGNQLAGDPCPGTVKELVVDYTYGNERHSRTVQEGYVLSLP